MHLLEMCIQQIQPILENIYIILPTSVVLNVKRKTRNPCFPSKVSLFLRYVGIYILNNNILIIILCK